MRTQRGHVCVVIIPSDEAQAVEEQLVDHDDPSQEAIDVAIARIVMHRPDGRSEDSNNHHEDDDPRNVIATILVREPVRLYLHHHPNARPTSGVPNWNVRATRLAMACGHFAMRFKGTVVLTLERSTTPPPDSVNERPPSSLLSSVIAATRNCDLRDDHAASPEWLLEACRNTYHDAAALQRLADVMRRDDATSSRDDQVHDDENDYDYVPDDASPSPGSHTGKFESGDADDESRKAAATIITTVPLCFWCRRSTSRLCTSCRGVYFCNAECEANGYVPVVHDVTYRTRGFATRCNGRELLLT
jgi:hypothetical protein